MRRSGRGANVGVTVPPGRRYRARDPVNEDGALAARPASSDDDVGLDRAAGRAHLEPVRKKAMSTMAGLQRVDHGGSKGRDVDGGGDRYGRLLQEAAAHIEELERGLMALARLPVDAHAARLGLLHELLGRCGQGVWAELKVASALRSAGLRPVGTGPFEPFCELAG
jgi:hypothetical protein